MTKETNRDYFARRAADERQAADQAADAKLATLHTKLADRYEELAGAPDADEQHEPDPD